MKRVLLLTLVIGAIATSCDGPSKVMDSWKGHTKSELYQKWGPPNQVTSDGADGEILIYTSYINLGQTAGTVYNNGSGGINYTAPQQNGYNRTRMFYVHPNGIIYSWRWQGL